MRRLLVSASTSAQAEADRLEAEAAERTEAAARAERLTAEWATETARQTTTAAQEAAAAAATVLCRRADVRGRHDASRFNERGGRDAGGFDGAYRRGAYGRGWAAGNAEEDANAGVRGACTDADDIDCLGRCAWVPRVERALETQRERERAAHEWALRDFQRDQRGRCFDGHDTGRCGPSGRDLDD